MAVPSFSWAAIFAACAIPVLRAARLAPVQPLES